MIIDIQAFLWTCLRQCSECEEKPVMHEYKVLWWGSQWSEPHCYGYHPVTLTLSHIYNHSVSVYSLRSKHHMIIPFISPFEAWSRCHLYRPLKETICVTLHLCLPATSMPFLYLCSISLHDDSSCHHVRSLFFIDEEINRAVELIQLIPFSISTSYDDPILVFNCISTNFIIFDVRDIELSLIIHD